MRFQEVQWFFPFPPLRGGARYGDTGPLGVDAALRAVANQDTRMHGSMPCLGQRS